jgi:tRNA 2-thiouridine synthesizing protein A
VTDAESTDEELDLRGEVCPFTFVRTRLRLEELPPGTLLRVRLDHRPAATSVPRAATALGYQVLSVEESPTGQWIVTLRSGAPAARDEERDAPRE